MTLNIPVILVFEVYQKYICQKYFGNIRILSFFLLVIFWPFFSKFHANSLFKYIKRSYVEDLFNDVTQIWLILVMFRSLRVCI